METIDTNPGMVALMFIVRESAYRGKLKIALSAYAQSTKSNGVSLGEREAMCGARISAN
ncbi:hypothetical protein [Enhygromyxa salina]|uniref:hypothetical protein n=1 Tax=Enhygromyxa salina TaxID=215803 RepID=UPI0012932E49|nr:hypothetical protein [Enhygromyxa salina]